ncbi:uncharacterized protein F5147DRAFT_780536 [Suillus discolor]|uniref:Uncharacterized protein n=1 Tax=Suillus discolor TaxID=1912936 RepID=A0A9P7ETF0_9AGAM|nr:uncharacterized protein F5147DRAFT_780536 [Suillus discolor]KAG2089743.1 hypothetical protein F5147DRAFT_780536 [Suillus discolor]
MPERQVRFATSVSSEAGDSLSPDVGDKWTSMLFHSNPTQHHSVVSTDLPVEACPALHEDPIDWWGTYVPLESWVPPKPDTIPRFQGIVGLESYPIYKLYKLHSELPHCYEYQVDSVGKKDKNYELCFNGNFDEVTSMLSDMYVVELLRMPNFLTAQHSWSTGDIGLSPAIRTSAEGCTRLEEDPVQLTTRTHSFHEDVETTLPTYHPYDCGWDDTISNVSVSPQVSSPMDPYDCGWEDDMNVASEEATMPLEESKLHQLLSEITTDPLLALTDERLNGANPTKLSDQPTDEMTFPMDDPYNCGWDDLIINKTVPLNESPPEDPYDCGWGGNVTAAALQAMDESAWVIYKAICELTGRQEWKIKDPMQDDPMEDSKPAKIALMADPYDCGWQDTTAPEHDIMPAVPADDPYDCGWGLSMNVETPYPEMMEAEVANDHANNRQTASMMLSGAGMESTDDLYDCGWEDPMEGPTIMWRSVDQTFNEETDILDLTSTSANQSVDWTFNEDTDVIDLTSPSANQSVNRTFKEETDVIDLTSTSANSERSMSPTKPNAFQEHRTQQLIVVPGAGLVYDSRPGLMFMANQHLFGAYTEARDRVTDLGADVINIHHLLNIHHWIMYPLDAMITRVEQQRDSMQ